MTSPSTVNSPSSTRTATTLVHEALKQRILDGTYRPHEFVREAAVASELNVSRTPVREALRELVSEGWLEAIPHQGARVSAWTEKDAMEVFELRLVLEPMAVGMACRNLDKSALGALETLSQRMESLTRDQSMTAAQFSELAALNHDFHRLLIEMSGNRRLAQILDSVVRTAVIRRNFALYDYHAMRRSMGHHREILDAVSCGNSAWAKSVMQAHLLASREIHLSVDDETTALRDSANPEGPYHNHNKDSHAQRSTSR